MTYIVAELGANWKGDVIVLDRMIDKCAQADVDAIKLQVLSPELIKRHPEWNWYKKATITERNIGLIDNICEGYKIEWFCTPTYPECIDFINPYVDLWKIRHADRLNEHLVTSVLNTNKKVIISSDRPIEKYNGDKQIHQIYCIPKYPTDWGELNFDMIKLMPGFSNHCLDPLALLKAVRMGAEYLEFHLTDSRDDFAIDNKVSFSYSQMMEFMTWIRTYETCTL